LSPDAHPKIMNAAASVSNMRNEVLIFL